jgi:hypothetical protein
VPICASVRCDCQPWTLLMRSAADWVQDVEVTRAHEVAGDILAAATALAGLLLVFMGAVSTTYDSYATAPKGRGAP